MKHYTSSFVGLTLPCATENYDNLYFNLPPPPVPSVQVPRGFIQVDARNPYLLAVCAGIGGESGAAAAAYTAAATIDEFRYPLMLDFANNIQAYVMEANRRICSALHMGRKVCGSTLAMACMTHQGLHCANIGDSRIYRLRGGTLQQLSEDHNRAGLLHKMNISGPSRKGSLTLFLGIPPDELMVVPTCSLVRDVLKHDSFLICSSGLTDCIPDSEITSLISKAKSETEASDALLGTALRRGCKSSITFILLKITNGPTKPRSVKQ